MTGEGTPPGRGRERTVAATLCMVSAAAAMTGLLALSMLARSPPAHSLTWFAVAAYGISAPLAFTGYVLSLLPLPANDSETFGVEAAGTTRWVPLAIDLGAAAGVAGLFAGAACMTTALLFGNDFGGGATHTSGWPLYAYAVVFALLASVLVRASAASRIPEPAFAPTNGHGPAVQLVADNTRPWRVSGRAKALSKRRLRIDPFAESELHDFSRKYGCTPEELRAACVAVGTVAEDVEAYLAGESRGSPS